MANTISGKVHKITEVQEIKGKTGNSFYKRLLVIDAKRYDPVTGEPKFDNYPSFEFSGEAMKLLDDYKVGDAVTVSYDINGREFQDPSTSEVRYFNTIKGYKIERYGKKDDAQSPAGNTVIQAPKPPKPTPEQAVSAYGTAACVGQRDTGVQTVINKSEGNDLPF